MKQHWQLDPAITFLNHGSFGACPRVVLDAQRALRERMEAEPVRFLDRELEALMVKVRARLGTFLGCDADDLAFVPNATHGVNTVVRSLKFERDDELLTTSHAYNACRNALEYAAESGGARVVVADVPFPLRSADEVVEAVLAKVSDRTRLALLDHVTSPTGLVFPIQELVRALADRGVDTLVDGAHAPGMVPLNLTELGAAYYTGNLHKWVCAPKGSAFLHVRRDLQPRIRPLSISHGANAQRRDRSRFRLEFDWTGTCDPTPWLCVPAALDFLGTLDPEGLPGVMRANRALALEARTLLARALGVELPCPAELIGTLVSLTLPDRVNAPASSEHDPLQDALLFEHGIEVPVFPWPRPPHRLLRVAAQRYNTLADFERLARVLPALLA